MIASNDSVSAETVNSAELDDIFDGGALDF
jgi:hypothetical protein